MQHGAHAVYITCLSCNEKSSELSLGRLLEVSLNLSASATRKLLKDEINLLS